MLLGGGFGVGVLGVEKAMEELKTIAIWGLAPIAVMVAIVFFWNLLLAPFVLLGDRIESVIKDFQKPQTPSVASQKSEEPLEKAIPSHWKHVQEFQAWSLAYLCAGFSPIAPDGYQNDKIRAKWAQIMGAINRGQLKTKAVQGAIPITKNRWIERKELLRYFKELGEMPNFLKE